MPEELWDTGRTSEGIVGNWFYRDGSTVDAGAKVAELMVEKTVFDIEAPAAGQLRILVPKDGVVRPGTLIGRIDSA